MRISIMMTRTTAFVEYYFWSAVSLISFLLLINVGSGSGEHQPAAMFVFGDSILDAGNNNYIQNGYRANFWPYGETFFSYSTGRFTDGRTIVDFISEYAKLPFIPPYLQPGFGNYSYGVNFASSGSGALPETSKGSVIDLKTQVLNFKNLEKILRDELGTEEEAEAFLSSAVYLFSVGGNDYFYAFDENPALFNSRDSLEEYVGTVIGNLTNVVQEIYNKGGRKFGFLNIFSLGCVPWARKIARKPGCLEELEEAVKLHNKALSKTLQTLADEVRLDGFKYLVFDLYASLNQILNNPSKYGFKETEMACCGSGPYRGVESCGKKGSEMEEHYELCNNLSDFVFFDAFHPTEKVNEQLAQLFWTGDSDMAVPYSLKSLFQMDKESCGLFHRFNEIDLYN